MCVSKNLIPQPVPESIQDFFAHYHDCFYVADLNALKACYVPQGPMVYFDNHAACDSLNLNEHMFKVKEFILSGPVPPLAYDFVEVFLYSGSALCILTLTYQDLSQPKVRGTFLLEDWAGEWKIRHAHYSNRPV